MRLTAVCLLAALPAFPAKRAAAPAPTYSNTREIPAKCETVWPLAMRALMAVGFAPRSADHVAGFMALDWTRGAHIGYVLSGAGNNDVRQFTLARPRILVPYNGFSIRSATAVFSDAGATCHAELSVVYQGYREVTPILSSQKGWFVLPSNNYLESLILQKIVDQLPADSGGTKPAEPAAQAIAAALPKPEPANEKPTTPPPLREPPADTQVVTLPGPKL